MSELQFYTVRFTSALRLLVIGCGFVTGASATPARAAAAPSHAQIDLGTVVECRDVTSPAFAASHPQEKIVEARFRLSLLLSAGEEQHLEQLQMTINSPERRLRVVDFHPRTEVASDMAGNVEICNSDDTIKSLNASIGGLVSADQGPAHGQVSPAAGVGVTQNRGSKETYHRLPPKQLVLASGTTGAEHGVFFKWKRSNQATLEGSREVICEFLVPRDWRGDWVEVVCEVLGKHRNYFGEKLESCGAARAVVALYLSGDHDAEQAAYATSTAQVAASGLPTGASPQAHVVYKPVEQQPVRSFNNGGFALPSFLKFCDRERDARTAEPTQVASAKPAEQPDLPTALDGLRKLSGTRP